MNKSYKDLVCEEVTDDNVSKDEVIDLLKDIRDTVDSPTEAEFTDLFISLVKMDMIKSDAFPALFDALEEIMEVELVDQGDYETDDNDITEEELTILEKQKPLYKRKGYVKCPNGKIRKRGKCGKPVDKKKSRTMRIARKKNRQAYKKGQRKTKITKRRLGQRK